jgi:hypothetical protein
MSGNNGNDPVVDTKIVYPSIEIPGRGTFIVKYSLGASYTLEDQMGMDDVAFARALHKWFPHKEIQNGVEVEVAGQVSKTFLFKVLSACIWDQVQISPRELADCFETWDNLAPIAKVIAEAFSKTRWSAQTRLQEPATPNLRTN